MALEATGLLTQDADPGGTALVDTYNGFNKLSRLEMFWTVFNRWPAGASFAFNCYRYWAKIILRQPGGVTVILLSQEGIT